MEPSCASRSLATTVGSQIKAARKAAGYTQSGLAQALGLHDGMAVSKWERGIYRPSDENLVALSILLKRDLGWFFGGNDERAAA